MKVLDHMALIPFTFSSTCVYLFLALLGSKSRKLGRGLVPPQAPNPPTDKPRGPGDCKHCL